MEIKKVTKCFDLKHFLHIFAAVVVHILNIGRKTMIDKSLRTALFSGLLSTIPVATALAGAWITLNNRVATLEIQVQNDHNMFIEQRNKSDQQMSKLMDKIEDIHLKVNTVSVKLGAQENEGITNPK